MHLSTIIMALIDKKHKDSRHVQSDDFNASFHVLLIESLHKRNTAFSIKYRHIWKYSLHNHKFE